jgi:hypothetical protein
MKSFKLTGGSKACVVFLHQDQFRVKAGSYLHDNAADGLTIGLHVEVDTGESHLCHVIRDF